MRGVLAAVVVLAATLTLRADPVTDEFKARWATTKAFTLEVADAMPEADYGFRPTPGEMTFGALMWHIAIANEFRFSQVAGVAFQPPAGALQAAPVWGFDTESRPTFEVGQASEGPHIIQLATLEQAFEIRLELRPVLNQLGEVRRVL